MPQAPFPIYGFAPNLGVNVAITQKNLTTGEEETVYTASDGSFLVDPANLPSGYNAELGSKIRVSAPTLGYYAEVVVNTALYPDGISVVLTNNPIAMIGIVPADAGAKFPRMDDNVVGLSGNVSVGKGGLG